MDSSEAKNDLIARNSSDSSLVQDSTIFSYVRDISPIKHFNGPPVAESFPGQTYSHQVFTSPQINPQSQSSSLERPQYHHLSSECFKQNGDKTDDIAPLVYTHGKSNTDFIYQVNSQEVGHSSNNCSQGEGGITSESADKYWEHLLKVLCDDAEHVTETESSLKQSDIFFKDFAECINYNSMNGEHDNGHVRTELQVSAQHPQLHTCGGEPGVVSTEQKTVVKDSKVSQQMSDMPGRCLQYDESQQNTVAKNCSSMSQPDASSILRSFSSKSQVLESSCAVIYAPLNTVELENTNKPTSSTFHASKVGRSSIAVPKPSGIGLHLNSILNALPMGCGASASVKSADEYCMIVQGQKSLCTRDSHSTDNAGNSPTSSKAVDGLLKPTEHHSTSCDNMEYTKLSSQKIRKRSTGFSGEDGCKSCNCKKTKCLKLYCDCFAAGYYCAQTCSCQGCFNSPEYKDTVLDTRRHIVSRDPLAFAPKILQHVGESPANNIQDINKSTPSSARYKRGCNCKKSMCLKRYCECYQSNVGCSVGCQCAGCKNVYGKKEANNLLSSESGSSKHTAITEATNDIPEISSDQKLDTFLHSDLGIRHNTTPFTPLLRYSDLGKHALQARFSYGRCSQSPKAVMALSATHEKPSNSTTSSDSHKMIEETCQTIPDSVPSDLQLYDYNSKSADDFLPHRSGINSRSLHHNPCSVAVACLTSQTTNVKTNDTSSHPCPESGTSSSQNSSQLCSSPITLVVPLGKNKLPVVLDSDSQCYNILEDDDIPEIHKEHPVSFSEVKVISPNKKRVSPRHSRFPELRPSSSMTALRGGRKFTLKAVPSFPPLDTCTDVKSTSSPSNML